jgi:hypothetical protein
LLIDTGFFKWRGVILPGRGGGRGALALDVTMDLLYSNLKKKNL